MSDLPDYFMKYEHPYLERTASGVLTLQFHTNGGPITFTECWRTLEMTTRTRCESLPAQAIHLWMVGPTK